MPRRGCCNDTHRTRRSGALCPDGSEASETRPSRKPAGAKQSKALQSKRKGGRRWFLRRLPRFAMFKLSLLLVGLLAATVSASTERAILREDWVEAGRANPAAMHEVVFAIEQRNLDTIERILYEVSDPRSEKYGQHLSHREVGAIVQNPVATEATLRYIRTNDGIVVHTTKHGEYIKMRASVGTMERMFRTEFFNFRNGEQSIVRAKVMTVPDELRDHITTVFNTVQMPERMRPGPVRTEAGVGKTITPSALVDFYNIVDSEGNDQSTQAVYESLDQYYSPSDLSQFQTSYDLPQDEVDDVIGGHESDSECKSDVNNCAEANLDVQYMMAISQYSPTTYWYTDDSFTQWIQDVADTANPPLVFSISYGAVETEMPAASANSFNTEAMKLGTQGVTITVSSGDDGVANFQARYLSKKCGYNPSFPATSPYVTAVGATKGVESGSTEVACLSDDGGVITTGGGFSTIFDQPSYQTDAVAAYFAGLSASEQPASGYNADGRGYPDVAMAGYNYEVVDGGKTLLLSGTSASSPVFAGLVSLVNANRLANGKSALGFLNPALYQNPDIYNSVGGGENNCTAGRVCCDEGFYASESGWDPLTGYGSVDYAKFKAALA